MTRKPIGSVSRRFKTDCNSKTTAEKQHSFTGRIRRPPPEGSPWGVLLTDITGDKKKKAPLLQQSVNRMSPGSDLAQCLHKRHNLCCPYLHVCRTWKYQGHRWKHAWCNLKNISCSPSIRACQVSGAEGIYWQQSLFSSHVTFHYGGLSGTACSAAALGQRTDAGFKPRRPWRQRNTPDFNLAAAPVARMADMTFLFYRWLLCSSQSSLDASHMMFTGQMLHHTSARMQKGRLLMTGCTF